MANGKIVFAQSGNRKIAVHLDSFINATYRSRRDTEALILNQGNVGSFRQQTTLDNPGAREIWLALRKEAREPGSQLFYMESGDTYSIINLARIISGIFDPDNPLEKHDLRLELIGYTMLLDGPHAENMWAAMEEYAQLELVPIGIE